MKYFLFLLVVVVIIGSTLWYGYSYIHKNIVSPLGKTIKQREKPLLKYTFENLRTIPSSSSSIVLGKALIADDPDIVSQLFYFSAHGKKVSGLLNVPKNPGTYPVVVMFRGFVPKETFTTGEGTRRTAQELARNGFITLAPDFLGYGESDPEAENAFEGRFQTYTTAQTLLSSLSNVQAGIDASYSGKIKADTEHIGIWGHSNGGHIALSVLAITGKSYPTVLWNPVTKPFPYSILYYTDEYDDEGKALRKVLADFEALYDISFYSPAKYYDWIQAPIQLNQAGSDEEVPLQWSDEFYTAMQAMDKDIVYYVYPGENHNFNNGRWPEVMQKTIAFFREQFTK